MITKHRTGSLTKRGSNYYVRAMIEGKVITQVLRDENGNAITTKREAEMAKEKFMAPFAVANKVEALQSIVGALSDGKAEMAELEDRRNPPLPVAQAWTEFIGSPNRPDSGPETLYQYECQWSAFAGWIKDKHPDIATLRGVTREIAEEYAATLNGGRFSSNTYNKHLGLLTLVFRVVKHKAKLAENPWADMPRKRLVTHSRREFTVEELRKVCQDATGELRTLLALGLYCGLRLGDCATLRWGEVDLQRAMIRRIPNKTARHNPRPVVVPIHPVLRDMLSEVPAEKRGEYVLPDTAALYAHRTDAVTDLVQNHFRACGITLHKPGTGPASKPGAGSEERKRAVLEVGFHSLRHTFVSLCRESNAPLAVVEAIVGHSNPAMTRHYTHIGELAAVQAVAALPALMGDAKPEPPKPQEPAILREIRAIVESITAETWGERKAAILAMLDLASANGQRAPQARQ
jgi:integrase